MLEGLSPIHSKNARLLILGSMPSPASLEAQQYYAFSTNAFWKILGRILGAAETYAAKKRLLIDNRIALWDVIAFCERKGALDSAIKKEVYNDLPCFLKEHTEIERVLLNGEKAERAFLRCMKKTGFDIPYTRLPSTSAGLTMPFEEKLRIWKEALS